MHHTHKILASLLAAGLLTACATDRITGAASDVEATNLEALPAPGGEVFYKIGPLQNVEIEVVGAEQLSGSFLTNEAGNIVFPFLGEVAVGGKSPTDGAEMIADGLRGRYVLDPQVRIVVEDIDPPTISVGGQVKRPGAYPAERNSSLLRAVNQAEGLDDFARLDDVLVLRTVDGRRYIGVYNLKAIQRGNYADPALYPNDIVLVGDSPARRRLATILQFVPILTSSIILLDRLGT